MSLLKEAISAAFADEPFMANPARVETRIESEYLYVTRFFQGRRWSEVTVRTLRKKYRGPAGDCLGFMSDEAFCAFVPAFMFIHLEHYGRSDAAMAAVNAFLLARDPQVRRIQRSREALLTLAQRRAVVAFLEHVDTHHAKDLPAYPVRASLDYWKARV